MHPSRSILVLCTGNSARSQMAAGFLKSLDPGMDVHSAGTNPARGIHPLAVRAMREVGIDILGEKPRNVRQFLGQAFDYVITVCDDADRNCPIFRGKVGTRVHIGFPDPAAAVGSEDDRMSAFRAARDEICSRFTEFYQNTIRKDCERR